MSPKRPLPTSNAANNSHGLEQPTPQRPRRSPRNHRRTSSRISRSPPEDRASQPTVAQNSAISDNPAHSQADAHARNSSGSFYVPSRRLSLPVAGYEAQDRARFRRSSKPLPPAHSFSEMSPEPTENVINDLSGNTSLNSASERTGSLDGLIPVEEAYAEAFTEAFEVVQQRSSHSAPPGFPETSDTHDEPSEDAASGEGRQGYVGGISPNDSAESHHGSTSGNPTLDRRPVVVSLSAAVPHWLLQQIIDHGQFVTI